MVFEILPDASLLIYNMPAYIKIHKKKKTEKV